MSVAILDTETNYKNEVISIGIVIADDDLSTLCELYYIVTPECEYPAMFSGVLYNKAADLIDNRREVLESILFNFNNYGVSKIFAYNAQFDFQMLPELSDYDWYDIIRIAAYMQYNNKIDCRNCFKTGRLKSSYGVESMFRLLSGNCYYYEVHNALCDAIDELQIMRMLNVPIEKYIKLK